MNEERFWHLVGWFHEISDTPCSDCVVNEYRQENNIIKCDKSCAEAIKDVYRKINNEGI